MLTDKSKLCVDIVVAIASAPPGQPVSTHSLSTRLRVSISYLESVLRILREARLIQSIRGPGGGYCMARDADEVSVWDVVREVDEGCQTGSNEAAKDSLTQPLDEAFHHAFREYLASRTIDEFVKPEVSAKGVAAATPSGFRLGPMPERMLPRAPASVFDLPSFMQLAAA